MSSSPTLDKHGCLDSGCEASTAGEELRESGFNHRVDKERKFPKYSLFRKVKHMVGQEWGWVQAKAHYVYERIGVKVAMQCRRER